MIGLFQWDVSSGLTRANLLVLLIIILSTLTGSGHGFPRAMMMGSTTSYSTELTSLSFSVTSGGTTAFCDLSFATDFTCISHAQVACTLLSEDGSEPTMGRVEYSGEFIAKIDGIAYNIDAMVSLYTSSSTISSLTLCMFPTCSPSSSSLQQDWCLDYSAGCGSSSTSSRSSSSPSHSTFKYISSSYVSYYSSSSSFSSSSSVADFGWSSGSEGVVFAWPSFESSSEAATSSSVTASSSVVDEINTTTFTTPQTTAPPPRTTRTTTVFTTAGAVTNSRGSIITDNKSSSR